MTTAGPKVFLHIGAHKSGTTYLQNKLWHNRDQLMRDGIFYPKYRRTPIWASAALRGANMRGAGDDRIRGAWNELVGNIRSSGGPGIIDQEQLAEARPEQVARAFRSLDWADVHVIYTLRDMARTLPAAWQETMKNLRTESFADFLRIVHLPDEERLSTGNRFWRLHHTEEILTKWSAEIPAGNVHVVTLPQDGADPSLLWARFAAVIGVDPTPYADPPVGANTSLSAPAASYLRRLNVALGGPGFPWPPYNDAVKKGVAVELAQHSGPAIALPPQEYEWAVERSRQAAEFIRTASYDVVGDLDELAPGPPRAGMDPDAVPADDELQLGVSGVVNLLNRLAAEYHDKSAGSSSAGPAPAASGRPRGTRKPPTGVRKVIRKARRTAGRLRRPG
jgi:hypothetical protein